MLKVCYVRYCTRFAEIDRALKFNTDLRHKVFGRAVLIRNRMWVLQLCVGCLGGGCSQVN